jgi:hypothetical protein
LLGHIFCRKGILDPKKLPVMYVIDFVAMSDTDDLPVAVASPATCQTKSGCTSFKNELTHITIIESTTFLTVNSPRANWACTRPDFMDNKATRFSLIASG